MTQVLLKIILSVTIILAATVAAKKFPSVAGLIAVMPLTGAMVLVWVYLENKGDSVVMQAFAKGALWGILPSILFFLVALLCLKQGVSLPALLAISFGVWLIAGIVHQSILR